MTTETQSFARNTYVDFLLRMDESMLKKVFDEVIENLQNAMRERDSVAVKEHGRQLGDICQALAYKMQAQ